MALGLLAVDKSESSCIHLNCNPEHSSDRTEHLLTVQLEAGNGNCSAHLDKSSGDRDSCSRSILAQEDNFDLSMDCCDKRSLVGCSAAEHKDLDRLESDGMRMYPDLLGFAVLMEWYLTL